MSPTMSDTAFVSAFRESKSTCPTTRGFGLKLGCPLRDRWVTPESKTVQLCLEGLPDALEIHLLNGFWRGAEFMHEGIHAWLPAPDH